MSSIEHLASWLNGRGLALHLKVYDEPAPENGGRWLGGPGPGHLEINGPWPLRQLEWLEINPVVVTVRGRLVPPQAADHSAALTQRLTARGVAFTVTGKGAYRRPPRR